MDSIYHRIVQGLRENFPEAAGINFTPESSLGELPDWDSMAAVNLQTYLQGQFGIELPLELLSEQTRLDEIADFLQNPVDV